MFVLEESIPKIFGKKVFNDKVMKERLPIDIYKSLKRSIKSNKPLDKNTADMVANAMKEWAIENGATHFTHWFQPMTGITAEKHDSFIKPTSNGNVLMDFCGRELIKGEPDASSFPSGGLRATFEARGYTAWDPTSYAFIKDGSLCIPSVFYSYSGEVLDKKTPLLRSIEAVNRQSLRILKLFGNNDVQNTYTTVGAEQEYFLIDKKDYDKRKDLILCGRTLFGAKPIKGQELEDHYYGALKPRISKFMKDLDMELWKLGIPVKTKHNEVAPAQHELAQIYTETNLATDQNQITMEILKKVARKHDLVCLLHEKPFAGINGSGKHNNWSIQTDRGINLLEPGDNPRDNVQFLIFLCAVIKGVDEYADLLRISIASAGNDNRLGAQEAPPAIVSVFVGDEILKILESIEKGEKYVSPDRKKIEIGVNVLPTFPYDTTDRNRTSPFAFTGNKFEFRMVGSNMSISSPNMTLNTIVADELMQFADRLEKSKNFEFEVGTLLAEVIKNHKKVIFNGNNYSEKWTLEAKKRGLNNLPTVVDAFGHYLDEKNVSLFERHKILTRKEMVSRWEIQLENYCKVLNIEALTMSDMVKREIYPAVYSYIKNLAEGIRLKRDIGIHILNDESDKVLMNNLKDLCNALFDLTNKLDDMLSSVDSINDTMTKAQYYQKSILPLMTKIRNISDNMELYTPSNYWPYPTYTEILFNI